MENQSSGVGQNLGAFLKQRRLQRKFTLEQVAAATKINVKVLTQLEEDQYTELPAKPFVRGFVASYARYLGLDPQVVLTDFEPYLELKCQDRPSRDQGHSGYAFERRDHDSSRRVLWIVIGVFAVFGLMTIVILKPKLKHHRRAGAEKIASENSETVGSTDTAVDASVATAVIVIPPTSPAPVAVAPVVSPVATPVGVVQTVAQVATSTRTATSTHTTTDPSVATDKKPDALRSGADYDSKEVKKRVVFRALKDIRVRFQVDGKEMNSIIIRAARNLVLRGKEKIRFQVNDGSGVSVVGGSPTAFQDFRGVPSWTWNVDGDPFPSLPALTEPEPSPQRPAPSATDSHSGH